MEGEGKGGSGTGAVSNSEGVSGASCEGRAFVFGCVRALGMAFGAGAALGFPSAAEGISSSLEGSEGTGGASSLGRSAHGSRRGESGAKASAQGFVMGDKGFDRKSAPGAVKSSTGGGGFDGSVQRLCVCRLPCGLCLFSLS